MRPAPELYTETRMREVAAPVDIVWGVLSTLGGPVGWHAANPLWAVRAWLDRRIGGPGMRGRSAPLTTSGQITDFWVVEDIDPPRSLVLRAELRTPGTPRLGFGVTAAGPGSILIQRTWYDPEGPWGHVLWWVELVAHKLVFGRMVDNIVAECERRAAGGSTPRPMTNP